MQILNDTDKIEVKTKNKYVIEWAIVYAIEIKNNTRDRINLLNKINSFRKISVITM